MTSYLLKPKYDSRKSFYGKATVESDGVGHSHLISYETKVAEIGAGVLKVYGFYSPTTLRHIKEYAKQHGFKADTKKQMAEDYAV